MLIQAVVAGSYSVFHYLYGYQLRFSEKMLIVKDTRVGFSMEFPNQRKKTSPEESRDENSKIKKPHHRVEIPRFKEISNAREYSIPGYPIPNESLAMIF